MSQPHPDFRLLSTLAGAPEGGAETFFVSMTAAFQAAGLDQQAVIRTNPKRAQRLRDAGVAVSETRFGGLFDFRTARDLNAVVNAFQPHAVMSYMERASKFMPDGPHLKLARLGGYYKLKYFTRCDHLFCITRDIRRHTIEAGWPEDRTHFMPNFAEPDSAPMADRSDYDTPEDVPLIFTPSRLHKVKGLDTLITAMRALPDAFLWIAGTGPEESALRKHAEDEDVADRVRFLGWRTDTGAFFRACDVVAFPSRHEPFGTVTLEAWAYGKPLVVTDAQGPLETVRPEEDAVLVPKDNVDALADGLRRALEEPGLAARLVENASARHKAEYTRDACVKRYFEMIGNLLRDRGIC